MEIQACFADPKACTVAEKEIKLLSSENAAKAITDNTKDIKKYDEDIKEKAGRYKIMSESFDQIKKSN